MSFFHSLKNSKNFVYKKKEPSFIIPTHVVKDILKVPFTSDASQGPSDHLYKLEARCSLLKLSGISHDNIMKKLFTCLCRVKQKNDTIHEPF
jgi:hypothetical protein